MIDRVCELSLEQDKALVVSRKPFTIQLKYTTGETKQPITLGLDPGYKFVGFSAVTEIAELISGQLQNRINVSKLITKRRQHRRAKRKRLWYRKQRVMNRKRNQYIAPSIQHKKTIFIKLVKKLQMLLPISNIVIEVAKFDSQKLQNPEISGAEYQQGTLQGYNIRQYLLEKWHYKCVYCNRKNIPLEVEHMTPKSRNGSDRVINLTISCHKCNQKKGNLTVEEFGYPKVREKADKRMQASTFMNHMRWKLVDRIEQQCNLLCKVTFGYITKHNRTKVELKKSHINDAFVIAGGTTQERCKSYYLKPRRRNNRCLQKQKAHSISIRRKRYKLQPADSVKYKNKEWKVVSTMSRGTCINIVNKNVKKYPSVNNVKLICYGKGIFGNCLNL